MTPTQLTIHMTDNIEVGSTVRVGRMACEVMEVTETRVRVSSGNGPVWIPRKGVVAVVASPAQTRQANRRHVAKMERQALRTIAGIVAATGGTVDDFLDITASFRTKR